MSDWIEVPEAARRLDVEPVRVRQLIGSGALSADRWGGRWRVSGADVQRLAAQDRAGRPYAPDVAWWVLAQLDEHLRAPDLGRQQRARGRRYVVDVARGQVRGLRRRAVHHRGRVHRGLIDRLADVLVLSGGGAIPSDLPDRLVDDGFVEGYVRSAMWPEISEGLLFSADIEPNAIVHEVDDHLWPFSEDASDAGPAVAAVDLIERGDQRASRAARQLLKRTRQARR